jgi:hypothetical protein
LHARHTPISKRRQRGRARRGAARLGSALTLLSPVLFLAAFPLGALSSATPGLTSAFGGVLLYSLAVWRA